MGCSGQLIVTFSFCCIRFYLSARVMCCRSTRTVAVCPSRGPENCTQNSTWRDDDGLHWGWSKAVSELGRGRQKTNTARLLQLQPPFLITTSLQWGWLSGRLAAAPGADLCPCPPSRTPRNDPRWQSSPPSEGEGALQYSRMPGKNAAPRTFFHGPKYDHGPV